MRGLQGCKCYLRSSALSLCRAAMNLIICYEPAGLPGNSKQAIPTVPSGGAPTTLRFWGAAAASGPPTGDQPSISPPEGAGLDAEAGLQSSTDGQLPSSFGSAAPVSADHQGSILMWQDVSCTVQGARGQRHILSNVSGIVGMRDAGGAFKPCLFAVLGPSGAGKCAAGCLCGRTELSLSEPVDFESCSRLDQTNTGILAAQECFLRGLLGGSKYAAGFLCISFSALRWGSVHASTAQ